MNNDNEEFLALYLSSDSIRQVNQVDVSGFRPEELNVKVQGNEILVKGEHKEENQNFAVNCQFLHRVIIPEGIQMASLVDVSLFRPEELNVEVQGNEILVKGEHREDKQNVAVNCQFQHHVIIPKGIQMASLFRDQAVKLDISEQGDLTYQVDVSGFRKEELSVGERGHEILVKGEHKEENQSVAVHRQFLHRVAIPEGIQTDSIKCNLDENGRLSICAKKNKKNVGAFRSIPINFQ